MPSSLVSLLDGMGVEKAHMCGHHLGGTIAQDMAASYPNRVGRLVSEETAFCTQCSRWERMQTSVAGYFSV